MAKLPSYMKVVETRKDEDGITLVVRLRLWHPYVWFLYVCAFLKDVWRWSRLWRPLESEEWKAEE